MKLISKSTGTLANTKFQKRVLVVITHSLTNLILPILNVVVSFLVVRLASVELWGEFVNVLIVVQLGTHIISWGNKEYLLREFSLYPGQIPRNWQTSLVTRLPLLVLFGVGLSLLGFSPQRGLWLMVWSFGLVLYQAHDVLVVYRKAFVFAILVELSALAVLAGLIILSGPGLTLDSLVIVFSGVQGLKAVTVFLYFYRQTTPGNDGRSLWLGRFEPGYFRLALPFFLLGFSGLLQSRIDLYCVNYFLSRSEAGQYQVFINFMIYLQSISAFILVPFVKSLYRLGYETTLKIASRLFGFGLALLAPALILVYLVLTGIYRFELSLSMLLFGGLFVLPIFFYLPIIYALYKADLQSVVLVTNLLGAAINFVLNLLLLPLMGLAGAILASAVVQWLLLILYWVRGRTVREGYALAMPELS